MTFRIHEREIDGILFDIHGTLYKRGSDELFIPVQLELSRLLLQGGNYPDKLDHGDAHTSLSGETKVNIFAS